MSQKKRDSLVSIIVPTFNSIKFIKKTIGSILTQTYKNFEIIFIDDCSNDGTYEFLKNFKKNSKHKISLFKTKKKSGTGAAPRNLGIKVAKGELICFLDSDDIWEKDKLQSQVNQFSNKKVVYSSTAKYFNIKNSKSGFLINLLRKKIQSFIINKINLEGYQWFYVYNPIITSSILAHRSVFKDNLFDEDANSREDIDLWIMLRKKNFKFFFQKNVSVSILRRDESSSSNFKKELVTLIRSLSNVYFKFNEFSKLNFFLIGIIIKFVLTFVKINKKVFLSFFKKGILYLSILYFVIFYSPLFWYIGKPLLYSNSDKELENIENIVVFSGHGDTSYYNITYQFRYKDTTKITNLTKNIENIFLLGRLQDIPEQKIMEALLISDGFNEKKLNVIYKEFNNTDKNIKNVVKILKEKNIKNIVFVTSPYHTKRSKLLWKKYEDSFDIKIFKGVDWPKKNNFFEYSKNKKIIIYEYLSIALNFFRGNFK